jgi:cytidylate kinase
MNPVITIGRQLGSGGKQIGDALAQRLHIPCYDKELIQIASRESGLIPEFFEKADEKSSRSFFGTFVGFRSGYTGDCNYLCNETLFKIQSDVIRELAQRESCIFVGRCADYILRDHPRCLNVFVSACMPDRIRRICDSHHLSEKEAAALIEQTDRRRADYYNYYSNKTWGMATSYDLCINSSVFSLDAILAIIEQQAGLQGSDSLSNRNG